MSVTIKVYKDVVDRDADQSIIRHKTVYNVPDFDDFVGENQGKAFAFIVDSGDSVFYNQARNSLTVK